MRKEWGQIRHAHDDKISYLALEFPDAAGNRYWTASYTEPRRLHPGGIMIYKCGISLESQLK